MSDSAPVKNQCEQRGLTRPRVARSQLSRTAGAARHAASRLAAKTVKGYGALRCLYTRVIAFGIACPFDSRDVLNWEGGLRGSWHDIGVDVSCRSVGKEARYAGAEQNARGLVARAGREGAARAAGGAAGAVWASGGGAGVPARKACRRHMADEELTDRKLPTRRSYQPKRLSFQRPQTFQGTSPDAFHRPH